MSSTSGPPRLGEWLIGRITRHDVWADVTTGDLREEHAALAGRRGRAIAHAWYWLQAIALMGDRARDGLAGSVSALRAFFSLGDRPMLTFRREIVRALRVHVRQPLVAAAIVSTLALGLGVNAAAFQLVNAFILHPLPGLNVDGLVMISEQPPGAMYSTGSVAPANFYEWRREAKSLDKLAIFDWWEVNLAGGSEPERVLGFQVTGDFFDMFGLVPTAGRFLAEADEAPGATRVVVMSDRLWKRRFGARPDVVGQSLRIARRELHGRGRRARRLCVPEHRGRVGGISPHRRERRQSQGSIAHGLRPAGAGRDDRAGAPGSAGALHAHAGDVSARQRRTCGECPHARRGHTRRRLASSCRDDSGRGAAGAAHRRHEHREPAHRARLGSPTRDGGAARDWGESQPCAPPVRGREPGARPAGGSARARHGVDLAARDARGDAGANRAVHSRVEPDCRRLAARGRHARCGARRGAALQRGAGAADVAPRALAGAGPGRPYDDRRRAPPALPPRAGDHGDRARAAAARRRGPLDARRETTRDRPAGLRSLGRARDAHAAAGRRLRRSDREARLQRSIARQGVRAARRPGRRHASTICRRAIRAARGRSSSRARHSRPINRRRWLSIA